MVKFGKKWRGSDFGSTIMKCVQELGFGMFRRRKFVGGARSAII